MSYSCNRRYHLYDTSNERDKHYREAVSRWQNCTHGRCPLRYNTKDIPKEIQIPDGHEIPKHSHESKLNRAYKGLPKVESNPAPAGSLASPRIPSSSFRSPLTPVSVLTSPPEPEKDSEPLSSLPFNLGSITDDLEEKSEEEEKDEPIPEPGKILHLNPDEDLPIRRAQPSFMASTTTTTESISTNREWTFGPTTASSSPWARPAPGATAAGGSGSNTQTTTTGAAAPANTTAQTSTTTLTGTTAQTSATAPTGQTSGTGSGGGSGGGNPGGGGGSGGGGGGNPGGGGGGGGGNPPNPPLPANPPGQPGGGGGGGGGGGNPPNPPLPANPPAQHQENGTLLWLALGQSWDALERPRACRAPELSELPRQHSE